MSKGTVIFASGRGWFFCEEDATHSSVFIHIRDVANERNLHIGDRVQFDKAENPRAPGRICAVKVKYIGQTLARQVGGVPATASKPTTIAVQRSAAAQARIGADTAGEKGAHQVGPAEVRP